MQIKEIITNEEFATSLILKILNRMHIEGPIFAPDFELLAYVKKFHPIIFSYYEPKLMSLLWLFYKIQNKEPQSFLEEIYSIFAEDIKNNTGQYFTPVQANAFNGIKNNKYFSFSAPTSAGKSFLFQEIIRNAERDIIIIVPTRALIAEYISKLVKLLEHDRSILILPFIEIINKKNTKRRIYVLTPERGNELFKNLKHLNIDIFLFDEAQISEEWIRWMKFDSFVRRVKQEVPDAKKVFTHPFVVNPEAQLIKHKIHLDSNYMCYQQNSVWKIFMLHDEMGWFHYFSPYIKKNKNNPPIKSEEDIVEKKIVQGASILIYVSKSKIYSWQLWSDFEKYINLCPKINNWRALKYVSQLKEHIGATDNMSRHSILIDMMERWIVIHHGSMPLKARLIIEEFINNGYSRICFSTSTLTQGINMPFDIVWINYYYFIGVNDSSVLDLKNLIGRAGRTVQTSTGFDYGYVIVEENNVPSFCKRMAINPKISETSNLDNPEVSSDIDVQDIIEAIKENKFNDELQLTQSQVDRLEKSDLNEDILLILDNLLINEVAITGNQYYLLEKWIQGGIKESFKKIFISHLKRKELTKWEKSVLSAAIPILLWQIQGRSFSEIISLRYWYLIRRWEQATIKKDIKLGKITEEDGVDLIKNLTVVYSQWANQIPDKNLKKWFPVVSPDLPVDKLEYDLVVYDTYDYIDKVIGLSLKDPLYAAFWMYFKRTGDMRAKIMNNYIKYWTKDEVEIWLIKYGFSFDDIEWLKKHIEQIDENEIIFKDSIILEDEGRREVVKRFMPLSP